jgi:maleylacetoacetate isomerase
MLKLHSYFRSSAAYRCRIALNLKGLAHELAFVHLIKDGGQQNAPAYRALNPQGLVPALEVDGQAITQSLAIIEYLDEAHPEPKLLPGDALQRARIRAFALAIACDIHPLNNLRVLNYLKGPMGKDQAAADAWYRHWVENGLAACEALLPASKSRFCFGDAPTLADVCLVPQVYNARRFKCDLSKLPRLVAIDEACRALPAFANAAPEAQADAA